MPDGNERGDHAWVDTNSHEQIHDKANLAKSVFDAEIEAIDKRRQRNKKDKGKRDRTACPRTGLAFSGGGIRSASFGLGALQAVHASSGIEGIDYLSTVSGGGYIGCSLTAAMQNTGGEFPFTNPENYDDTESVRHIRDFSNYLIPHGALDAVPAIGAIGRGLVANVLIVLPILLFCVWITLVAHPDVASLGTPKVFVWDFSSLIKKLGIQELHGYWFTIILAVADLAFLIVWAFATSLTLASAGALRGGWVRVSQFLFFFTLITALFETQPFILWAITQGYGFHWLSNFPSSGLSFDKSTLTLIGTVLGAIGTIFAHLAKKFSDVAAAAKRGPGWRAWIKKISAQAALWYLGIIIPSFLWLLYLQLTYLGISQPAFPYVPDCLSSFAHATLQAISRLPHFVQCLVPTVAALLYLEALGITLLVALLINPNRTSLHRLYRDRLGKAFLFDPLRRDKHGDLQACDNLKLHKIDTDLCPYPIINAALNIEGSQYANKRGRNADFFIFTSEYTGSGATGYIGTQRIEKEETALDLGTAMAISGAALAPDMGAATLKALTFTLALVNVRLGYWLRNPRIILGGRPWYRRLPDRRSFLLFKEMFGLITEKSPTVYLTDGGHIENLGVYSLLKRRCKVIVAIDAEADPGMSFLAFLTLERYARIDLGAIIDLPWQAIRDQALKIDEAVDKADADGSAIPSLPGPHCAAGEIQYGPNETGILLYVKASLSGDESDYILDYQRRNRAFPHETTGDQFFGEEQLEAYRALGFHIMSGLLTEEIPFAVAPRPNETEAKALARIQKDVRAAFPPCNLTKS